MYKSKQNVDSRLKQCYTSIGRLQIWKGGDCMYALDFSQVGANIQKQLDAKGFTQQRLADILGISKQVMNKIIKGNKAINVNELAKIASVLGTTTDELLTVSGEPTSVDSFSFMGSVTCEETREKINLMRQAIDEIHMLEDTDYV